MERREAIIRLIIGLILLINSILSSKGMNPIPISEEELYEIISWIVTFAAAVYGWWWKNNNITKEAIKAQTYLDRFKGLGRSIKKKIKEEGKGK